MRKITRKTLLLLENQQFLKLVRKGTKEKS